MKSSLGATFFLPPPEVGLPLFWSGMGEEVRKTPEYLWHGLRRETQPRLLWQLTLQGEGTIEIGNHPPVALRCGEGFIARIPSDHCYYYRPGSPAWRFVWVIWSGPALETIANAVMGRNPVRLVRMDLENPAIRALRTLVRLGNEVAGDPWRNSADAYRLLLEICRVSVEHPARSHRKARVVTQAQKILQHNPGSAIGKSGLAASVGLSRFQLYRAMKHQLGISPHEWAARQRIAKACHLLKTTRHSIATIAIESGLRDANYFARFFRQHTGFSPRDWRRLFAGR